jgi:hypothetical protein
VIRYWRRRYRGAAPAADREATRTEAVKDLIEGLERQIAALRAELAAAHRETVEAKHAAALAGLLAYYYMRRPPSRPTSRTVVLPRLIAVAPSLGDDRTEVFRR